MPKKNKSQEKTHTLVKELLANEDFSTLSNVLFSFANLRGEEFDAKSIRNSLVQCDMLTSSEPLHYLYTTEDGYNLAINIQEERPDLTKEIQQYHKDKGTKNLLVLELFKDFENPKAPMKEFFQVSQENLIWTYDNFIKECKNKDYQLVMPTDFKAHLQFDLSYERTKLVVDEYKKNFVTGCFRIFLELYHLNRDTLKNHLFKCQYDKCGRYFISERYYKHCPERGCTQIKNQEESANRIKELRQKGYKNYY